MLGAEKSGKVHAVAPAGDMREALHDIWVRGGMDMARDMAEASFVGRTPALFVLAHNDDEFFISATMQRLSRQGPVTVLWLTRGGLHADRRERESRQAMELLGVPAKGLRFLRLRKCRVLDNVEDVVRRLVRLMAEQPPRSVFVPAFEGGHPDHDAAQLAAAAAIRRVTAGRGGAAAPRLYEFPLYHINEKRLITIGRLRKEPFEAVAPGGTSIKLKDRLLKRRLARIYRSQRLLLMPLLALRGGPMMVYLRREPWREVPTGRDYTRRPPSGSLACGYFTRRRFEGFTAAAHKLGL